MFANLKLFLFLNVVLKIDMKKKDRCYNRDLLVLTDTQVQSDWQLQIKGILRLVGQFINENKVRHKTCCEKQVAS